MYKSVSNEQARYVVRVYIDKDWLAATLTDSAFTLIGPAVSYAGVHAQAESVCQNCALGRCSNVCVLILSHLTSLFFCFCRLGLNCR